MNAKRSLARRFILSFVIVGAIICFITAYIGIEGEWSSMGQQYYDMAYYVADVAASEIADEITAEELKEYAQAAIEGDADTIATIENSQAYQNVKKRLNTLRENMQLTDVYVTIYSAENLRAYSQGDDSWKPLVYIFDNYVTEDKSFQLGDCSAMNPDNIELFAEVVETEQNQDDYIISNGDFGYNMSALKPILTEDGQLAAVIGVEVPMLRIEGAVKSFVKHTILVISIVVVIVIILYLIFMYRGIVIPINLMSKEVKRFGDTGIPADGENDYLSQIKTKDEMQLLAGYVVKMEKDLVAYVENIKRVTAEKERIGAELNVATQIQASQLPNIFPAFPDRKEFELYASMDPAKEVGGDFYDFFMLDQDHIALVIADVSGKGVPAALFMMISMVLIRTRAQMGGDTSSILEQVNNQICETNEQGMFVTVWLAIVDLKTGHVVESNAGHEHPAIKKKDGDFELVITKHSPAVATIEGMRYRQNEYDLEPGDRIFVYTDGVPEATDANNEMFGTERMLEVLNRSKEADGKELLHNVRQAVDEFVGEAPQFDDLTMLTFKYNGSDETA
ncbi:PP2C family protein-serine/threonine phosphatase [Eubacterium oxidoreducens]|uniref:Stage II sporulation protein E (SpoIIE) n=1 Tax=Eubacterium oxidoreducens TaxID=1732 RepID=A0A1G6AAE6_EUBOX|nr:PP2C family protein-serine/threonine phosphatase [Eubacterium oxidoreducens]SDB05417.1 Stage II sporulation protein E (SpoIIE) [Eubacterium oxidoreducens]